MPRTYVAAAFAQQKRIVHNRRAERSEWNIRLDEFERIVDRGCYFCSVKYTENDKFYTRRIDNDNYSANNSVTLCERCSVILKGRNIPNFLKFLVHIGSRLSNDVNIDHYDAFYDESQTISYGGWVTINGVKRSDYSAESYERATKEECKYCNRETTNKNHNRCVIRRDGSSELLSLCSMCEAVYNSFDTEESFENYILEVYEQACDNIKNDGFNSKLLIANHELHICGQEDACGSQVRYSSTNLRFVNVANDIWTVNTSYNPTDPNLLAVLESNNHILTSRDKRNDYSSVYSHETCMLDHHNQYIDSVLFSPTKPDDQIIVDNPYTRASTKEQTIEHIVKGTFPIQLSLNSELQLGIITRNTKLMFEIIYSIETKEIECIKIYGNIRSVTQCPCNSDLCEVCIFNAYDRQRGIKRGFWHEYDITNVINNDGNAISRSRYVKRTRADYSGMTEDEKARARNHYNIMYERSKALQNIQDNGEKAQKELRAAHRRKYNAKIGKVKKVAKGAKASRDEFKWRQIDLYGEERYSQITSLQQRIYRAKKKEGFPEHTMRAMLEQLAVLKA